jgi:hypothetical protein
MQPRNPDYPVRLDVDYPPRLSRLLIFVKWLLAFPHYVVLWVLGIVAWVILVIAFFAVLITGRYPESLWGFLAGFERWRLRVAAYVLLQTDRYPPFSLEDDPAYPARLAVDYPDRIERWRPLVHWLLVIPAALVAYLIDVVAVFGVIIAWFAILITARYPQALFDLTLIALRWSTRVQIYAYFMVSPYPPFVWA